MDSNSHAYHKTKMQFHKVLSNKIPKLGNLLRSATGAATTLLVEQSGLRKAEGDNLASFTMLVAAYNYLAGGDCAAAQSEVSATSTNVAGAGATPSTHLAISSLLAKRFFPDPEGRRPGLVGAPPSAKVMRSIGMAKGAECD